MTDNPDYRRILRTAIVTARNAPSHERVITTLEHGSVDANEVFFLGGMKSDSSSANSSACPTKYIGSYWLAHLLPLTHT